MKGIYLIAIAFLASCTIIIANVIESPFENEDECPPVDPCPPILLPDEKDCTRYYECKEGTKLLHKCPAGLQFSQYWQGCVEPAKSDCGGCINGNIMKHECNCTKFYSCKKSEWVLQECPYGMHFSPDFLNCVSGLDCKEDGPICREGEKFHHECICQQYYVCRNGQKALQECKKNWHFDEVSSNCVKGKDCKYPEPPPMCQKDEMNEHECDCQKYYTCDNEEWVLQRCTNGQHFSPRDHKCMSPEDAGCEDKMKYHV